MNSIELRMRRLAKAFHGSGHTVAGAYLLPRQGTLSGGEVSSTLAAAK